MATGESCNCDHARELQAANTRRVAIIRRYRKRLRASRQGDDPYFYALADAIDQRLGWANADDEEGGDYTARVEQVAAELTRLRAERAYCRGLMTPAEIRQMEKELADEREAE